MRTIHKEINEIDFSSLCGDNYNWEMTAKKAF